MPEFRFTELLPTGPDTTEYRRLAGADGVAVRQAFSTNFLEADPQVLTLLTREAMRDIAHLLRPAHLSQLRPFWTTRRPARTTGTSRLTC